MTIYSLLYGGGERSKISFSQYSAGQNYWGVELQNNISIQGAENENPLNGYCTCPLDVFTVTEGNTRKSYELLYFYSCDNSDFSNWIMLGITTWNLNNYQKTYQLKKLIQAQTIRFSGSSLGYTVPKDSTNIIVYLFGGIGDAKAIVLNCETYILNLSSQTIQYSNTISITNEEQATNYQGILHPKQKTYVFYGGDYSAPTAHTKRKTSVCYYLCNAETIQQIKDPYQYGYYHPAHGSGLFVLKGTNQLYILGGLDSNEEMKNYYTVLKFNESGIYQSYDYNYPYVLQGTTIKQIYILTGNYLPQQDCSGILLHGFYDFEKKALNEITYSSQRYRIWINESQSVPIILSPILKPDTLGKEVLISNLQLQPHFPGQFLGYGGTIVTTEIRFSQDIQNNNKRIFLLDSNGLCYDSTKEEYPYLNFYPLVGEQYILFNPKETNISIQYQSIVMIPITKNSLYVDQEIIQKSKENTVLRPNMIPYTGYVELESDTITGSYLNDGTKEVESKIQLLP